MAGPALLPAAASSAAGEPSSAFLPQADKASDTAMMVLRVKGNERMKALPKYLSNR
jgi:hypothetical protein